jgi:hypothetical protein
MPFELPYTFSTDQAVGNALFLSPRWIDAATVTASSTEGLLTADNVQTARPDQVWRATGDTAEYLAWDFGEDVMVEALALVAHNLSSAATLRLRLGTSEANVTAAPGFDSGAVSAWPVSGKPDDLDWQSYFSLVLADNATGYRYGRVDIADSANVDGYVQVGRLFVGPAFVPSINVDINPSLGLTSPDEAGRSAFGHTFGDNRGPAARVMQLPMSALDEDEMGDELFELQRYCGLAKDFAFCLNPEATTRFHRYAMQARFSTLNSFTAQPAWNEFGNQVWQTTLSIEEML